jgi:hypothetical protein
MNCGDPNRKEDICRQSRFPIYHTISPSLTIGGAAEAIEFYKRAFGATKRMQMSMPDGKIAPSSYRPCKRKAPFPGPP